MKTTILLLLAVCLVGCSENKIRIGASNPSIQGNEKAAQFIIEYATAANPLSDEEGEDLVEQCESTARQIFGVESYYAWIGDRISCRESISYAEALKCAQEIVSNAKN